MNTTEKQFSLNRTASKKQIPISQWKLAPPKHVAIEVCGALDAAQVQHQMAEFLNFHAVSLLAFFAMASFASPAWAATSGSFLESSGLVVMEAEHFHGSTTASGHTWEARTDRAGFVGESAMRALPNSGVNLTANVAATSPVLSYQVEFATTGTYNFWVRGFGANGSDDSVHIGVDGQVVQSLPYSQTGVWMWRAKQVVISSPGLHEINVWMREDGTYVDRILLAANLSFTPTGTGPAESARAFAEADGLVVMEAEHYDSIASASGHEWLARTDRAGFVGAAAMQALPNTGANISANITAACPVLNYNVVFNTTGTYNFWIRGFGANGSDDSVHIGLDGQVLQTLPYSRTGAWMWSAKQVVISSSGLHVVNVWMREDGTYVDRVLLSANLSFVPSGDGPPESNRLTSEPGEPPPEDPAGPTVWPNQTSHANSDQWLADNHDNLRRMNPRLLVVNFSNEATPEQLDRKIQDLIAAFAESSRYHGYEDPGAPAFLNYQLYKFVDLRDPGSTFGNSSKIPVKANGSDVDHRQFYGEQFARYYGVRAPENPAHFLTLGELIDRGYVHELWYFALQRPDLLFVPREVVELKARYDEHFQRIGNEFVDASNGSDPDNPWTGRSVRIGFIHASRGIGCFLHNFGHGVEATSLSQAIPYFTRYFTEFAGFDLDTRFGQPGRPFPWRSFYSLPPPPPENFYIEYPDPHTAIVTDGAETRTITNYVAYGGNCHFPPNARKHYDYHNTQPVMSTIEDWRIGSGTGGADLAIPWTDGALAPFGGYDDDCGGQWLIYWRQNFPGLDNLQQDDAGAPMKNWWPFLFY